MALNSLFRGLFGLRGAARKGMKPLIVDVGKQSTDSKFPAKSSPSQLGNIDRHSQTIDFGTVVPCEAIKPTIVDLGKQSTNLNPRLIPIPPHHTGTTSCCLRWLESKLFAWLPAISFAFMGYSSIMAIYQSKGDPSTVAFVAGSVSILGGLYWCMHEFERAVAQRATTRKERLKFIIWLLAIALNTLFSYRVTSVIDSAVFSAIIWSIAGVTTVVGCYIMFFSAHGSSDPAVLQM